MGPEGAPRQHVLAFIFLTLPPLQKHIWSRGARQPAAIAHDLSKPVDAPVSVTSLVKNLFGPDLQGLHQLHGPDGDIF